MTYTPKQKLWRKAAATNRGAFVQSKLRIADLLGRDLRMKYQWGQQVASDWIREQERNGDVVRDWIVKWRRAGITSMRSAEGYARAYGVDNARIGVIAHLEERAKEILANYSMFDRSIERQYPELLLEKSKDNIFGLKFALSNAQVLIGTAKNPIKIRGDGIHVLDGSEAAHWFNQFNVVMKEVCPVVPPLPGTQIVLESTGSYIGSAPFLHWEASTHFEYREGNIIQVGKKGKNEFSALFLCWLDDLANVINLASDKERDELYETIRMSEPRLSELNAFYKLTPGQIAKSWQMYHLQADNDFDYFCREFPYSSQMAWSAGGDSYFGVYELTLAKPEHPKAIFVFEEAQINRLFQDFSELKAVSEVPTYSNRPNIKVWALPKRGDQYVIGSDASNGMINGDYSYGSVINKRTREQMCSYHGLLRPDEHAHIMVSLCRIYNNALAGPETNPAGGGMEILNCIQRLGYHRIYEFRKRDRREGITTMDALGWWTNGRTKPLMLGELRKFFVDCVRSRITDTGMFRDASLLQEMRTFSLNPLTGQLEANIGCFDDRVVGAAIAHQIAADEVYCTRDDALFQAARANTPKPVIDQAKLVTKVMSPDQVIKGLMGKNSNFMRNKFEI